MELIEYADADMMLIALASALSRDLRSALARRERVLLCLPGGTTPGPVFEMLAAVELEWARVDIVPSDERWLPHDHPRSNAGQIRQRLLHGPAAAAQLLPMWREGANPSEAAEAMGDTLKPLLPIDVALLGMGADGHVASLFPGAAGLDRAFADDAPPVVAFDAVPGQPEARLSLSVPVLRKAFSLHLLITGQDKRDTLERASGADPLDLPVAAVLGQASVHWSE
ncbi:MAG: 6-phosphogluconolactonase PglS [Rhodobacteraceae bacterium HLUCCA12]|nr:MAG: 6-phosphogluconolactonase PglS [Rhodobacteraceae bacterium HLUCCA12]